MTKTQWLEQAAIAYLKQNPPELTEGSWIKTMKAVVLLLGRSWALKPA
jgi:hypothetical protein